MRNVRVKSKMPNVGGVRNVRVKFEMPSVGNADCG